MDDKAHRIGTVGWAVALLVWIASMVFLFWLVMQAKRGSFLEGTIRMFMVFDVLVGLPACLLHLRPKVAGFLYGRGQISKNR